ncbi:MAG TPA: transglutaminase domain-containing protein, partial [Caulobacteraceae bacterium]|nr:transglutaminase domain-containing protein [Caulobacteraceae bacterium]
MTRPRGRPAHPASAIGAALLVGAILLAPRAPAQSLPAMKFVTAPLISPGAAETVLGASTTHTYSVAAGPPPEIVETARALKSAAFPNGDPDLMFEYVHNQIDTEFAFGERKGPLGTLIDRSGTPFDQNALFVALARQAGLTASYQIGAYTLSQANFTAWTGVSDLGAACALLSSGGIPAAFTPSAPANCQTTGAFTSVTILTAWSRVVISGVAYYYDPAFKTYAGPAPMNLAAAAGFTAGQPAAKAGTGMNSGSTGGAPYIATVNAGLLDGYLQSVGTTLLNGASGLKARAPALDTRTVVGIAKVQPLYKPSGGWRVTTSPGVAWLTIPGDIPDQFRAQLQVQLAAELDGIDMVNILPAYPAGPLVFYVDDIDGRRLGIDTNFDAAHDVNPPGAYTQATESLVLDGVAVTSATCAINRTTCLGGGVPGQLSLTAVHPYPAGAFANQTVVKPLTTIAVPVAIVSGWGRISPARLAKWNDEVASDKSLPHGGTIPFRCEGGANWCIVPYNQSAGDFTRQKLAASWLAQMTWMARLQSAIGGGEVELHHSIGVVDWRAQMQGNQFPPPPPSTNPNYLGITDEFTDLNIDSVLSVTGTAAGAKVAAISRAIALAAATLEGSVLEQMEDLPDTASTASRFAWGNVPDNEDPCFSSSHPRPFYDYT